MHSIHPGNIVICFLKRFSNQVLQLDLICNDVLAHRLAPTMLGLHMSLDCGIHNNMLVCNIVYESISDHGDLSISGAEVACMPT